MKLSIAGAAVIGATLLAACSADSTAPAAPATPATVATEIVASATGRNLTLDIKIFQALAYRFGGGATLSRGVAATSADAPARSSSYVGLDCAFDAGAQHHVCPLVQLDSMSVAAEYWLWDGDQVQPAYDDYTTDSAQVSYRATGRIVNPDGGMDNERTRTFRARGLGATSTERRFGGGGVDSTAGTVAGTPGGTFVIADTTTITDVVFRIPFWSNVWPASGTFETRSQLDLTESGVTTTTHRHVTVTFNGTQIVPMDVDGAAYTLDLGTGAIRER
jgi:hypothetical protein